MHKVWRGGSPQTSVSSCSWWPRCRSLGVVGGQGLRGTHSGLALLGRKKINLSAPKDETVHAETLWGIKSCKEDSEEKRLQASSEMLNSITALLRHQGWTRNRKGVGRHWPWVSVLFWSRKRKKIQLNPGMDGYIGQINITGMLCALFIRGWPLSYSGKHVHAWPPVIFLGGQLWPFGMDQGLRGGLFVSRLYWVFAIAHNGVTPFDPISSTWRLPMHFAAQIPQNINK